MYSKSDRNPTSILRKVRDWSSRFDADDGRLVRRILEEHAKPKWKDYLIVLVLGGVGAGCTALAAYILGTVVDRVCPTSAPVRQIWRLEKRRISGSS